MPTSDSPNRITLIASLIAVCVPIASGFLVIYSDIQVLNTRVQSNEQKFVVFETFVKERDPLTGRELRTLLQEVKNEIRRNRDMRLCARENN